MSSANVAVADKRTISGADPTFPPLRTRNNSITIIIINDAAPPLSPLTLIFSFHHYLLSESQYFRTPRLFSAAIFFDLSTNLKRCLFS